jgi:type IV pilus assembly protein PilO
MDISLTKLPWYAQVGAFVALAVGGVVAFYYYYELPARADMVTRQAQLKLLKADITKGLATAKKLDEFRDQVADLEARLDNLKAVLPEEKDAADLLRSMQNVAMQSNLTIRQFTPKVTVTQELHAEWPISLELEGTYHNLAIFFERVGKFTRIVNISGLAIQSKPQPTRESTVSAKCMATTFVLLDPAAVKPKGKPKPPAPKKAA